MTRFTQRSLKTIVAMFNPLMFTFRLKSISQTALILVIALSHSSQ